MLTVQVTEEHISKGKRRDPRGCAISLALQSALGEQTSVGDVYYRLVNGKITRTGERQLPKEAIDFRVKFDREEPVEPFSFEIVDPRE